ncbi:hypothetical protein FPHOBKDP_00203 [Listeria phage LPJP1]|nr:hypothetical protein FPHOBKDP_00203 [Listeria phage LPJP1]
MNDLLIISKNPLRILTNKGIFYPYDKDIKIISRFDNSEKKLVQLNNILFKDSYDLLIKIMNYYKTSNSIDFNYSKKYLLENSIELREYSEFFSMYRSFSSTPLVSVSKGYILLYPNSKISNSKYLIYKLKSKYASDIKLLLKRRMSLEIIQLYCIIKDLEDNNIELFKKIKIEKNGKEREVIDPNIKIKNTLKEISKILDKRLDRKISNLKYPNIMAYRKNVSIKDNALMHLNNKYIIKVDISNYFPSIDWKLINSRFILLLFHGVTDKYMDTIKKGFVDENDKMFLGNPVSGVISNIIMVDIINHIQTIFHKYGIICSSYSDDITFSTNIDNNKLFNKKFIIKICNQAFKIYNDKFKINDSKTVYLKGNMRNITGITINHKNQLTLSSEKYDDMRNNLYSYMKTGSCYYDDYELLGKMSYYLHIDETGKFRKLYDKYINIFESIKRGDEKIEE